MSKRLPRGRLATAYLRESSLRTARRLPIRNGLSHVHDIVPNGVAHEVGHGVKVEFAHDIRSVGLCRLDAQVEGDGNLLAGFTLGEQLNDLALPSRETFLKRSLLGNAVIEKSMQNRFGYL